LSEVTKTPKVSRFDTLTYTTIQFHSASGSGTVTHLDP
jgi:hypothetical protein